MPFEGFRLLLVTVSLVRVTISLAVRKALLFASAVDPSLCAPRCLDADRLERQIPRIVRTFGGRHHLRAERVMEKSLFTLDEASEMLGWSKSRVHSLI